MLTKHLQGLSKASIGLIAQSCAHIQPLQPQQLPSLCLPLKQVMACKWRSVIAHRTWHVHRADGVTDYR